VLSWKINRLIFSNTNTSFNENNWTFFSRELFPIFKNFKFDWLENIIYFNDEVETTNIFNYTNTNLNWFPMSYNEYWSLTYMVEDDVIETNNLMFILTDQISTYISLFFNLNFFTPILNEQVIISTFPLFFSNLLTFIGGFLYLFLLIYKLHTEYGSTTENSKPNIIIRYNIFITSWLNFASIKFESFEEAFSIIILWPWCIVLIFTHLFTVENNEVFFIFIEWGLPVAYGFLILFESAWLFSTHLLIYLNGARGRRSLIATMIEDCVALIILTSRITLQMIRGLICGFFHDFFREISEYLIDTWELYVYYASWQVPFCKSSFSTDLISFFIDWYLISFILLFIYFILFLQLLFLVIAVWLFCRCWFISIKKPELYMLNYLNGKYKSTRDSNFAKDNIGNV